MIWEVGVCGIWIRNGIVELGFGEFDFSINVSDSVESIFFFWFYGLVSSIVVDLSLWEVDLMIWFPKKEDQRLELGV